jgi:hypothetical protein
MMQAHEQDATGLGRLIAGSGPANMRASIGGVRRGATTAATIAPATRCAAELTAA